MNNIIKLTILMPCLNEEKTIKSCIEKAFSFLKQNSIQGEVLIADNGSTDKSIEISRTLKARVINIEKRGYGSALIHGINAAQGEYIVMGDADNTYDFSDIGIFLDKLEEGYDLVIGNRFTGKIEKGAMPFLHRYLGNPILSGLGKLLFNSQCNDFHCGIRAFRKDSIQKLNLCCYGMEFASEMIVKATLSENIKITEVPVNLYADKTGRRSHLNTWTDGWRHLEFLMLFCPTFLFIFPGLIIFILGFIGIELTLFSPYLNFDIQTLLLSFVLLFSGIQSIIMGIFAKLIGKRLDILPNQSWINVVTKYITLKSGMILSLICFIAGSSLWCFSAYHWYLIDFGPLDPRASFRLTLPGSFLILAAIQILVNSFFLAFIKLEYATPNTNQQ